MEINNSFEQYFKEKAEHVFSCGGRIEILGNHTDHNHGMCMAGTCNLAIYAATSKASKNIVTVFSEGFGETKVDLSSLKMKRSEKGKFASLIRGIAFYLNEHHHKIGGLNLYISSKVPGGAGVSSSAAFELLIAEIFAYYYNEDKIDRMELCKAGQYAERNYYGKMCGLLDQIGVGFGGSVFIDFHDMEHINVESIPFPDKGYRFLIVNTPSSHAGLDDLYKAIPDHMYAVANYFGKDFLGDLSFREVQAKKDDIIAKVGKDAYDAALHFYSETERVALARSAIKEGNLELLMDLMNNSCFSSTNYLKNMKVSDIKNSPLEACNLLKGVGGHSIGVKINGGGFAGSVVALVKDDVYDKVVKAAVEKYGEANVYEISIRESGPKLEQ